MVTALKRERRGTFLRAWSWMMSQTTRDTNLGARKDAVGSHEREAPRSPRWCGPPAGCCGARPGLTSAGTTGVRQLFVCLEARLPPTALNRPSSCRRSSFPSNTNRASTALKLSVEVG
jgi:hypothetical protein